MTPKQQTAEVSGKAFLGLIRFVKAKKGERALQEVSRGIHALSQPITTLSWHPYADYGRFLGALARVFSDGSPAYGRRLGMVAAERDLLTIFRLLKRLDVARLTQACTRVWDSYHRNAGRMEPVSWTPEATVVRILDFPAMHPVHCYLMDGWMHRAIDLVSGEVVPGDHETLCPRHGGPYHEFTYEWTPKAPGQPGKPTGHTNSGQP